MYKYDYGEKMNTKPLELYSDRNYAIIIRNKHIYLITKRGILGRIFDKIYPIRELNFLKKVEKWATWENYKKKIRSELKK